MTKRLLIFSIIIIIGLLTFLILKKEKQKTDEVNSFVKLNFKRKIIDSFSPKLSQEIYSLEHSVYRTALSGDNLLFLTETNVLYSFKGENMVNEKKILNKSEYWYINFNNLDTSYFDKNNNLYYNSKTNQKVLFKDIIQAVQEINDTTLLLHRVKDDSSYLTLYDLKNKNEFKRFELISNLNQDKFIKIKGDPSLTFGEFSKNSKNIYYTFFNASYIVKYNIGLKDFLVSMTKDSLLLPNLIEKKVPINGTIRTFPAFSHEYTNISTTISDNHIYILSNVTTAKDYNFIDIYDSESMLYLYSIKLFASDNKLAYQINFVKNKIYLVYGNEKVYIKNIAL